MKSILLWVVICLIINIAVVMLVLQVASIVINVMNKELKKK